MNDPARRRSGRRDDDKDAEHLFWYWLPVAGTGIGLALLFLSWWIGS